MVRVISTPNCSPEYIGLYNDLLEMGKSAEEAIRCVRLVQDEDKEMAGNQPKFGIRLQYSMIDIREFMPRWDMLTHKEKMGHFWDIGLNTRDNRVYYKTCLHRRANGKKAFGLVAYSAERLDPAWLAKTDNSGRRVASMEALTFFDVVHKTGMIEELDAIAGR